MLSNAVKSPNFKHLFFRAAKLPFMYVLIGSTLIALAYIDNIIPLPQVNQWFHITDKVGDIFIAFSVITFIYKFMVLILKLSEKKLLEHHKVASLILTSLRKGLRIIVILAAINIIITQIGPTKFYLILANKTINTIIIGSVGWIAIQVLYTFEAVLNQQMRELLKRDPKRAKALHTKTHIMRNIVAVVIVVMTLAAILMSFSSVRNIGISILASAGFLTAIIGLAGQKALFSIFSGLQIVLSQPIKIGDLVLIEKESGTIEEINFTHVTLKLSDNRIMIVPINHFIEKPFENWSHDSQGLRSSFHFFVDYLTPIEPLRSHLTKLLTESTYWDGSANKLHVSQLKENAVELCVQLSAANAEDLSDLLAEIKEKMLNYIREELPDCFPHYRITNHQIVTPEVSDA